MDIMDNGSWNVIGSPFSRADGGDKCPFIDSCSFLG